MKTREQIYNVEASTLIRDITTYHCAKGAQLAKLYPGKDSKIENLLKYLVRQGRIFYEAETDTYYDNADMKTNTEMLTALWVLSDFGDKVEYHSSDSFPTKIIFFSAGEVYEIICIPSDKETLIIQALAHQNHEDNGKQILIVEEIEQINRTIFPLRYFVL